MVDTTEERAGIVYYIIETGTVSEFDGIPRDLLTVKRRYEFFRTEEEARGFIEHLKFRCMDFNRTLQPSSAGLVGQLDYSSPHVFQVVHTIGSMEVTGDPIQESLIDSPRRREVSIFDQRNAASRIRVQL